MKLLRRTRPLAALLLASALLLTSCGLTPPGRASAATMHLRQTEGKVGVSDGEGKDVEPREDLGLYSGYGVETKRKSFAWIDLDEVKLTKLDEKSEIEITSEDKQLEIEVLSGSLFFNISEPLEEDESLTIRSSTMSVGIRGTCGWVALLDDEHMEVYLLEGEVECAAGKETAAVSAGETALLSITGGEDTIDVRTFQEEDIPDFVMDELDEDLLDELRDLLTHGPSPEDLAALETIAYYGDTADCTMTPAQAAAFAQIIRDNMAQLEEQRQTRAQFNDNLLNRSLESYASLFDTGSGVPALFFGGGAISRVNNGEYLWAEMGLDGLWTYTPAEGAVPASEYGGHTTSLYGQYLFCGGIVGGTSSELPVRYRVYPLTSSGIALQPSSTASYEGENLGTYLVDGQPADKAQYDAWVAQWRNSAPSLTGCRAGGGVEGYFWGMSPAADVLAVLDNWGGGTASAQLP